MLARKYYGPVHVHYMGTYGSVCPDSFNNMDAAVVCREKGYRFGFAFNQYRSRQSKGSLNFYWLNRLNCDGTESAINTCKGFVTHGLGHGANCSSRGFAAVYCYSNAGTHAKLYTVRQ